MEIKNADAKKKKRPREMCEKNCKIKAANGKPVRRARMPYHMYYMFSLFSEIINFNGQTLSYFYLMNQLWILNKTEYKIKSFKNHIQIVIGHFSTPYSSSSSFIVIAFVSFFAIPFQI